jgi:hypothetical protein
MDLAGIDRGAVARALSQIVERDEDVVEAYFERAGVVEAVGGGADERRAGEVRARRLVESGLALRLRLASAPGWSAATGSTAGASPGGAAGGAGAARGAIIEPALGERGRRSSQPPSWRSFRAASRRRCAPHAAFPIRFTVRRHRRSSQVVGARLVPAEESERFWACAPTPPGAATARCFRRSTRTPSRASPRRCSSVFAPATRRRPAPPQFRSVPTPRRSSSTRRWHTPSRPTPWRWAAIPGRRSASSSAPPASTCSTIRQQPRAGARQSDDEGSPVMRRWLLRRRGGTAARRPPLGGRSGALLPGAARRASRHDLPGPRSYHLELLAREDPGAPAPGSLHFAFAERGALDPRSGVFTLDFPCGQRRGGGSSTEPVGPCRLRGRLAQLLGAITAVGPDARRAGAGWCAKGGQKLPAGTHAGDLSRRCGAGEPLSDGSPPDAGRAAGRGLDPASLLSAAGRGGSSRGRRGPLNAQSGWAVGGQSRRLDLLRWHRPAAAGICWLAPAGSSLCLPEPAPPARGATAPN